MITTKNVSAKIDKKAGKLRRTVSMDINHPYTDPSKVAEYNPTRRDIQRAKRISTRTMPDVADLAEKRKRDEIMAQRADRVGVSLAEVDLEQIWRQFVFVEIDDLIQAVSRRELK